MMDSCFFDFEPELPKLLPPIELPDQNAQRSKTFGVGGFRNDSKYRITVCRHWVLGLCQNGREDCPYLHKLDKSKMPNCKHGNLCKIKNCQMRHTDEQEISECIFYRQGFCYNGPNCVRRHVKRKPDECPQEASFDHAVGTAGAGGDKGGGAGAGAGAMAMKKKKGNQPNENYKVSLCNHWLLNGLCMFNDDCHFAHGEEEINESYLNNDALNDVDVYDPTRNRMDAQLRLPFDMASVRVAYFAFQAPDLRSLAVSKQRGVWSVPMLFAAEINAAQRGHDHVVIYFLVRGLKGMYGVARLGAPINTSMAPVGAPMTPEFPIVWMRLLRIPMKAIAQMKAGSTGMFLGRIMTDCRFENKVGSEMLHICYRKPEWDWAAEVTAAESAIVRTPEDRPPPSESSLFSLDWIEMATSTGLGGTKPGGTYGPSGGVAPVANDFYKGELPGFIFKAPSLVIEEMFARSMFGLPAMMKGAALHPGAPMFIFDENMGLVLGIFQINGAVAENIEQSAFRGQLPVQAKFSMAQEAPPLHIAEPDFQAIFPGGPMFGPIGLRETKMLANVFAMRAGVLPLPGSAVGMAVDLSKMGMGVYKPPLKCVEVVPIDIRAPPFEIKKRVLGTNASLVKQITSEVGGSTRGVRIRIRGIGSGFMEGPHELQEPMHFNICAESDELLQLAVGRMKEIIARSKAELEPMGGGGGYTGPMR